MDSSIEVLYFYCYYAYLKGNREDTSTYYQMLRDEFKTAGSIESLNKYQLQELAKIKSSLDNNQIAEQSWIDDCSYGHSGIPVKDMNQDGLVKELYRASSPIRDLIGANNTFYLYNIEHPCNDLGFIDMYYRDDETAYPLEVKKTVGDHRLLGQILKYDRYCKFHLHQGYYKRVQAVTICGSYDDFTIKELKKNGVIPILYSFQEQLTLTRI
jgi:hypothetical protein